MRYLILFFIYSRPDRVVPFPTVDLSYLVRFGSGQNLSHGGIPDVVHPGFPTADSDVGSFSRGRTGDSDSTGSEGTIGRLEIEDSTGSD